MIINKVGAALLGALCIAGLTFPGIADAQSGGSTFIVPFERTGAPQLDDAGLPMPDTGAFVNPCTLEFVDVFGSSAISIAQSLDKYGNLKVAVSTLTKGTGSGWLPDQFGNQIFSGKTYVFRDSQAITIKQPPLSSTSQEFESDFFDKISMKGGGKTDNWIFRARFRIRIAADGTVRVNLVRVTEGDGCKG
jgi:hypothetical protein